MTLGSDRRDRTNGSGHHLQARLALASDTLSAKQRRVAQYLLTEPWQVAFASVAEVGARTGVTGATVVRFAQSLGYQGFTELQEEIRGGLPRYSTWLEKVRVELSGPQAPSDIQAKIFRLQLANIEQTAASLTPADFDRAVDLIAQARRIIIGGGGLAVAAVSHFAYTLRRIGIDAREASHSTTHNTLELIDCGPHDLFVGIGYLRYPRDTIEGMSQAVGLGMRTLAITDTLLSPLAQRAELTLTVVAEGLHHSSIVTTIALVDALAAATALRDSERSTRALQQYERLYFPDPDTCDEQT